MSPFQPTDSPAKAQQEKRIVKFQCPCCFSWLGTTHANKNVAASPCRFCGAAVTAPAIVPPVQAAPAPTAPPAQAAPAQTAPAQAAPDQAPPAAPSQGNVQANNPFQSHATPQMAHASGPKEEPLIQGTTPFSYHRN